jgi:hypothetical protein
MRMNEVILWAAFVGAWLLVAGPLYQGSIELRELDIDREAIEGIKASAVRAQRRELPSAWWWLLPPVMYYLRHRRNQAMWHETFAQLTEAQREQFATFRNKANGWYIVALGATLLAAGETWQIIEHHAWSVWLFWLLFVAMLVTVIANTAVRMILGEREHSRRTEAAEPS